LRRGIKIKASTILLAWLVTFVHGVLPHNHMQEGHEGCNSLIHAISDEANESTDFPMFTGKPDDLKICHYSSVLFKQLDPDNAAISATKDSRIFPVFVSEFRPLADTGSCFSEPYFGASSLRAPPEA
jgi:hypothetical protein